MSMLKNLDFFQKFSVNNISKSTMFGSILSLTAISIMVFLLCREIYDFYTPTYVKDTIIYHDSDQDSKISVNIYMQFFNMPCGVISVDQQDSIGNHRLDISDTLYKKRLTRANKTIGENVSTEIDDVAKAVEDGEGCYIFGKIEINKVPGNIHVSHHAYRQLWEYLKHVKPEKYPQLNLNHRTINLNFGDYKYLKKIFKRFGMVYTHEEFSRHSTLPVYRHNNKKNYDYFLKLIPYLFVDEELGKTIMGYQYSLNFRERDYEDQPGDQHIIMFNYDLSPLTMRITRKKKSYSRFVTHVCAIIGGIFVIFSIINRTYLTCFDCEN